MRWHFRLLPRRWVALQIEGILLRAMREDDLTRLFDTQNRELGKQWLEQQERRHSYITVAEVGGVPVGRRCLDLVAKADTGAAYGFAATVLPQWQSRGIGTLIDRHSEAVARARGFQAVQTDVSKDNHRGFAWHERLGYRKVGERVVRWEEADGQHVLDCWTLEHRWARNPSLISRFISRWRGRWALARMRSRRSTRAGVIHNATGAPMSREADLRLLNEQYIKASLAGDVEWYRAHLADEFVCIDSDGSVLDKAAFLRKTARGSDLAEYRLDEVDVRFYGDVAVVRATGSWKAKNGVPGLSRYVDIYARTGDDWKAVSAQITRPKA